MKNQTSLIEEFFEKAENYTRTSVELYKLKAIDKSADVISALVSRLVVIAFIALFFLIFNIGAALWIGEMLGRSSYGFFIIAGFYALAGTLFLAFRNALVRRPLRNEIITQALN